MTTIDAALNSFRVASRELFNTYFRVHSDPYDNGGWSMLERFCEVEEVLFTQLVGAECHSTLLRYGQVQPSIVVSLASGISVPAMINREINSGYWDHPIGKVSPDTVLRFVRFFDWDQLAVRDNRYVHVVIASWPEHPEVEHKHALLECQYASYSEA